jgi:RNA 2',3'-cyclic 3'-phosphodiesterase
VAEIGRAFVAVEPPPEVRDAIEAHVHGLREVARDGGIRFARSWHVTLQFLGRVDDADRLIAALAPALERADSGVVQLGGGGAFARARRGTVLWLGLASGVDALAGLAVTVCDATAPLGFVAEARALRPHVTLARSTRPRDLRPLVAAIGDAPVGPPWRVGEALLLASETLADGARYTEIERFPLASG